VCLEADDETFIPTARSSVRPSVVAPRFAAYLLRRSKDAVYTLKNVRIWSTDFCVEFSIFHIVCFAFLQHKIKTTHTAHKTEKNMQKTIDNSKTLHWRINNNYFLTEPVPYTFVSVNRRNNEAPGPHLLWSRGLHYSVDLRIRKQPVPLDMENSPQNIRGYTDIIFIFIHRKW